MPVYGSIFLSRPSLGFDPASLWSTPPDEDAASCGANFTVSARNEYRIVIGPTDFRPSLLVKSTLTQTYMLTSTGPLVAHPRALPKASAPPKDVCPSLIVPFQDLLPFRSQAPYEDGYDLSIASDVHVNYLKQTFFSQLANMLKYHPWVVIVHPRRGIELDTRSSGFASALYVMKNSAG